MSPARVLWLSRNDLERERVHRHSAAYSTRVAGAKREQWEKFEKEHGVGDA